MTERMRCVKAFLAIGVGACILLACSVATGATSASIFRTSGIAIRYPSRWEVTNRPLGDISDPVQRFVLSSYRVPGGRPNGAGDYRPPADGVIAQLLEDSPPDPAARSDYAPRPAKFRMPRLTEHLEGHSGRWGEIVFRDHGRDFYLFVGVGLNAPTSRLDALLRALDTVTVNRAP